MRAFLPFGASLLLLIGGCAHQEDVANAYRQQQQEQETYNLLQKPIDDLYNELITGGIDPKLYSIYDIRRHVSEFRTKNCDYPLFHDEAVRQHACQLADQAEAKIANVTSEKVDRLVREGMSRSVAERIVHGDIRVGDDISVIDAYGSIRDFRQLRTATGVTTRTEFTDGTVVYEQGGKIIAVTN